ncbi:hypothetical protein, partial [Desulfosarcina cetonica]
IYQLDTLINNPPADGLTEVEVIDPTHPLYGRRFPLISVTHHPPIGPCHVIVAYQKDIHKHIPISATNLSVNPIPLCQTKISFEAVSELVGLIRQLGVLKMEDSI